MLLIILFLIILISSLIVGTKGAISIWYFEDLFDSILLSLMIMILSVTIGFGIFYGISSSIIIGCPNETNIKSYNIVSLKTSSSIRGDFCLGTGTIKEIQYYVFYKDLGNDNYRLGRIRIDAVIIKETNTENPQLKWEETTNKVPKWIGIDIFKRKDQNNFILIVPKGTIMQQFKLE